MQAPSKEGEGGDFLWWDFKGLHALSGDKLGRQALVGFGSALNNLKLD